MEKLTLADIKLENTRSALNAIAGHKNISKLEISRETGLSLMTVGKVVSVLYRSGIISRSVNETQKAGRRAELWKIRQDWVIPVFEIASNIFKFYITDLEGEVIEKVEYICSDDPIYIGNEFIAFLQKTVEILREKHKKRKALGIGVSVSGVYDAENDRIISSMKPELSEIKLMTNISKIFKQKNVVIDNANRLCAEGLMRGFPEFNSKTVTYITINSCIEATTCEKGKYLCGSHNLAGRLGDLPYAPSLTYANFLRDAQNTSDTFLPILDLLKVVSVAYDPDLIYLCTDKFDFSPTFVSKLQGALQTGMRWVEKAPELHAVNSGTLESLNGIISRVINNWLDKIIQKSE